MRESLLLTLLVALVATASPLRGQDEAAPPLPPKGGVQITFLPPPMQGTLSLGIYHKNGALVRTLKREAAATKDFIPGLNGLITQWDGKDDAGRAVPPGVYSIRGYAVGALEISGEAFHGNDWITGDDSPHIREIREITAGRQDKVVFTAALADGKIADFQCGLDAQAEPVKSERVADEITAAAKAKMLATLVSGKAELREGKLVITERGARELPELGEVLDIAAGRDSTFWVVSRGPHGEEVQVQQYSEGGEFLRRLAIAAGDPLPEQIAAAESSDLIFLLERGAGRQQLRALALESLQSPLPASEGSSPKGAPKSSTWRIAFTKAIHPCSDFDHAIDLLGRSGRPKPEPRVPIKLLPNPLVQNASGTVDVVVAQTGDGSFLATADGLLLRRLTDTPGLQWEVLVKETRGHSLFQSDGAVVEEYRIGKMMNMMSFDAGEYELK